MVQIWPFKAKENNPFKFLQKSLNGMSLEPYAQNLCLLIQIISTLKCMEKYFTQRKYTSKKMSLSEGSA